MKLCFPATARPHLARQKLLLDELGSEVEIWEPQKREGSMTANAILYAVEFNNYLIGKKFDGVLIRGDRYEMLGLAMCSAYRGISIIHIEGGDLSGAVDNKVRHALTQLADYHFCTNEESHQRLISMGCNPNRVWNFGSLDVEFAKNVEPKRIRQRKYIMVSYHPIEGEDENALTEAITDPIFYDYDIVGIASNTDYGRQYGAENYSPEDYINLLRFASCCVGNSSSFLKEASILGVPIVNVGDRQIKRLKPKNVLDVPCESAKIKSAISYQLGNKFEPDLTYYKPETSKRIAEKLKEIL